MGDGFVTWDMLGVYSTFLAAVYMIVQFTKEMPIIKNIKTRYWCATVAFILMIINSIHSGKFAFWDIVLYGLTSVLISFAGKGLADWNKSNDNNIPPTV